MFSENKILPIIFGLLLVVFLSGCVSDIGNGGEVWNITNADFEQNISVADRGWNDLFFTENGNYMYGPVSNANWLNRYELSEGWNLNTKISQDSPYTYSTDNADIFLSSDGTKVFLPGVVWELNESWDITSRIGRIEVFGYDHIWFKPDGTKVYTLEDTPEQSEIVYQYSLSDPWNLATASLDKQRELLWGWESASDIYIRPDGTEMYFACMDNTIKRFKLSSPWDLDSASLDVSVSLDSYPNSVFFDPDGEMMFVLMGGSDEQAQGGTVINKYSLVREQEFGLFDWLNIPFGFLLSPFTLFLIYVALVIVLAIVLGYYINGLIASVMVLLLTLIFTVKVWIPPWMGIMIIILIVGGLMYLRKYFFEGV